MFFLLLLTQATIFGQVGEPVRMPDHTIDLVAAVAFERSERPGIAPSAQPLEVPSGGRGPRPKHKGPDPAVLSVYLEGVDRTAYNIGDDLFYELLIENVSRTVAEFPTDLNSQGFSRDMPGATVVTLALSFTDPVLGQQLVGSTALFGARPVPGSLLVVRPGETVRIRVPGKWYLMGAMPGVRADAGSWQRGIELRAYVSLHCPDRYCPPATSENVVHVTLEK